MPLNGDFHVTQKLFCSHIFQQIKFKKKCTDKAYDTAIITVLTIDCYYIHVSVFKSLKQLINKFCGCSCFFVTK